jgi:CRP-like cAMP-binding protein
MTADFNKKVIDFFAPYNLHTFDKGQILIYGGDDPSGITYLIKGEVRQYDIAPNGEELVVNVYKPGAFFPMYWAINKTPNNYFFETVSKVEVRQAPIEETIKFVKNNPDVMFDLLSRVYKGLDGVLQRMTQLMGGTAYSRTVFELVNACKRFGKRQPDGSYIIAIPENELAKRAGLTRETFNRELRKLKNQDLIKVNHSRVTIKDLKILEEKIENSTIDLNH